MTSPSSKKLHWSSATWFGQAQKSLATAFSMEVYVILDGWRWPSFMDWTLWWSSHKRAKRRNLFSSNVRERPFGFFISSFRSEKNSSSCLHMLALHCLHFWVAGSAWERWRLLLTWGMMGCACKNWVKYEQNLMANISTMAKGIKNGRVVLSTMELAIVHNKFGLKQSCFGGVDAFRVKVPPLAAIFGYFKRSPITHSKIGLLELRCLCLNVWNLRYSDIQSCKRMVK